MLVAPIIHARTKNDDFPSNLLVVPDDFSASDISWARRYILGSTRYFELSGKEGRRVIFCNDKVIVSGISIGIGDLYRACNQEPKYEYVDRKRTNYAFIGVVFHKSELSDVVDIPLEYLRKIYEDAMERLWDKAFEEKGLEAINVSYQPQEFPKAKGGCTLPIVDKGSSKLVIDENYAALDCIAAAVIRQMCSLSEYAFCSNMPNATSVLDSDFFVVTSPNAKGIIEVMKKKEKKEKLEQQKKDEEIKNSKESDPSEEILDFYRDKKRKFVEILKRGESIKKSPAQVKDQEFRKKSPKPKSGQEFYQEPQGISEKLQEIHLESQEIRKKIQESHLENQEIRKKIQESHLENQKIRKKIQESYQENQEINKEFTENMENQEESKKRMKKVFGGVLLFFSTLCVLISVKNDNPDSSSE